MSDVIAIRIWDILMSFDELSDLPLKTQIPGGGVHQVISAFETEVIRWKSDHSIQVGKGLDQPGLG